MQDGLNMSLCTALQHCHYMKYSLMNYSPLEKSMHRLFLCPQANTEKMAAHCQMVQCHTEMSDEGRKGQNDQNALLPKAKDLTLHQ